MKSCTVFVWQLEGADVLTIEGLADPNGPLHPMQEAFREHHGLQCGYCTPGMIMLTTALLREHPDPSDEQIRTWLSSNICRCTGYQMIIDSVRRAAELIREEGQANG